MSHTALNLCVPRPGALHTVQCQSATAERWHFSAFIIHVDGMELELHDNCYFVHVADECPIILAQSVQSIDGNWIELLVWLPLNSWGVIST